MLKLIIQTFYLNMSSRLRKLFEKLRRKRVHQSTEPPTNDSRLNDAQVASSSVLDNAGVTNPDLEVSSSRASIPLQDWVAGCANSDASQAQEHPVTVQEDDDSEGLGDRLTEIASEYSSIASISSESLALPRLRSVAESLGHVLQDSARPIKPVAVSISAIKAKPR